MCCRNQCSCGCGCGCGNNNSGNNNNNNGNNGNNGSTGLRPNCGWAYFCQFPGHRPMPLGQRAEAFLDEEDSGCGCG